MPPNVRFDSPFRSAPPKNALGIPQFEGGGNSRQRLRHDDRSAEPSTTLEPDSPHCGGAGGLGAGTRQYGSMIVACKV